MQDEQMVKEIIEDFKLGALKSIDFVKGEFAVLKAGRANPKMLDKVTVEYYGMMTPLSQMANISVPEARMLMINLWDISAMNAVRKALQVADLGASIADDGKVIRLTFPTLTEERRRDLVKQVKKISEDGKISLRGARRDCLDMFKTMKKDAEISEDEYNGLEKQVQKLTDEYNDQIDVLTAAKEKEVMEI